MTSINDLRQTVFMGLISSPKLDIAQELKDWILDRQHDDVAPMHYDHVCALYVWLSAKNLRATGMTSGLTTQASSTPAFREADKRRLLRLAVCGEPVTEFANTVIDWVNGFDEPAQTIHRLNQVLACYDIDLAGCLSTLNSEDINRVFWSTIGLTIACLLPDPASGRHPTPTQALSRLLVKACAQGLYVHAGMSKKQIAQHLDIARSTLYGYLG